MLEIRNGLTQELDTYLTGAYADCYRSDYISTNIVKWKEDDDETYLIRFPGATRGNIKVNAKTLEIAKINIYPEAFLYEETVHDMLEKYIGSILDLGEPILAYSTHESYEKLGHILELEEERGNDTTQITEFLKRMDGRGGLSKWVMFSPEQCFIKYGYVGGMLCGSDMTEEKLKVEYPDYINELYPIYVNGMNLVSADGFGGYLYVQL